MNEWSMAGVVGVFAALMLGMLVWDVHRRDHLREKLLRQIFPHPLRDLFRRRH